MDDENKPLRDYFEKIDAETLSDMQDRHEEESSSLEFKRMEPVWGPNRLEGQPSGEPSKKDIETLREAISGFANSAGGILLWGIDSKPPPAADQRDRGRFQRIVPIKDGERTKVRFDELTVTATTPAVNGVLHRAIKVEGGFVVKTFVPASDRAPHRTPEKLGQYFRRSADSFEPMLHNEIADMFGRRARPRLELLVTDFKLDTYTQRAVAPSALVGIQNVGRAVARFPKLVIAVKKGEIEPWQFGLDGNRNTGLPRQIQPERSKEAHFAGTSDHAIHPECDLFVSRFCFHSEATFEYRIYAAGMNAVIGERTLTMDDFKRAATQ